MDALTIAIPLQQQRQQKALINKNFIWKFFFFQVIFLNYTFTPKICYK